MIDHETQHRIEIAKGFAAARRALAARHLLGPDLGTAELRWLPLLNRQTVRNSDDPPLGFATRAEAVAAARRYRQSCRDWLAKQQ